jgi:hypothetical protein
MLIIVAGGIYLTRRAQLSMVFMELSSLMQSAPQLFRDLPLLMNLAQLIFYAGLALTFGGIIMRAYSGYVPGPARFAGRLVFGFLAVITGIGISWVIPYFSSVPIYMAVQSLLNVIPGGMIATAALYLALKMISYNIFNIPGTEKEIRKLEELKEKARKVERSERGKGRHGIRHPVRLAGLAAFAGFLAIGLMGFQGFPNTMAELGFSQDDFSRMADQIELLNEAYGDSIGEITGDDMEECMGAVSLLRDQDAIAEAQPYSSPGVEMLVKGYTGEDIRQMYLVESEGKSYILSITTGQACLSTTSAICLCQETERAGLS